MDELDEIPDPPLYFDRSGVACSVRRWAQLYEDRFLADDHFGDYRVATIYTGMDFPHIFETTVFKGKEALESRPWTTEAEAWAGHAVLLEKYRGG